MGYIALYRKWRPSVFEDVVEQEHVVQTLKHSVSTGRIAHAYLFCGTRGTGKTTVAHILSRAINCLNPHDGDPCNECEICRGILSGTLLDVLEIDAASNNSVDNIREIREDVVYSPSKARYKVYIIDEVHMLSTGAFNALLKTLEEPPSHVVFILATTEPHKLPATILSRCQRFDFRRISTESIAGRLDRIASSGGVTVRKDALRLIARMSEGAMRDAISLLDQCIAVGKQEITYEDVMSIIGMVNDTVLADMTDAVVSGDVGKVLDLVDILVMSGKDIAQFVSDLVFYYRNLLICKVSGKPEEIIEASPEMMETMKRQAAGFSREELTFIIKELSLLESGLKWSAHPRILLEVSLIKLCEGSYTYSNEDILERLSLLEKKVENADFSAVPRTTGTSEEAGIRYAAPGSGESGARAAGSQDRPDTAAGHGVVEGHNAGVGTSGAPAGLNGAGGTKAGAQPGSPTAAGAGPAAAETGSAAAETGSAAPSRPAARELACWEKVLNDLKKSGRMALYTCLYDKKAVELGKEVVGIVLGSENGFNKLLVSKAENMQVIEETLCKYTGALQIRVKCLDEEEIGEFQEEEAAEKGEEIVEKAKDLADRLGAPINIIDG